MIPVACPSQAQWESERDRAKSKLQEIEVLAQRRRIRTRTVTLSPIEPQAEKSALEAAMQATEQQVTELDALHQP